jgi:hypothetical protein
MGSSENHRRYAEKCVAMAQHSGDDSDRALWLTLAQSWVRHAEHDPRAPLRPQAEGAEATKNEPTRTS